MAALQGIQNDSGIRAYWQRKKAVRANTQEWWPNAVKFKLVLCMFAAVKRQKPYVEIDTYKK